MLDKIIATAGSLEWWGGVVVVGIAINIVSTLIFGVLERRRGARTAKRRQESASRVAYLRSSAAARNRAQRREARYMGWAILGAVLAMGALDIATHATDFVFGLICLAFAFAGTALVSHAVSSAVRIAEELDAAVEDEGRS